MNAVTNDALIQGVMACRDIPELVRYLKSLCVQRAPVKFGVEKVPGKSFDALRRAANQAALDLLNSLQPGQALTDAQRQVLAGYTGQGGIGGTESEYYTPQPIAEGVWQIMKLYGADTGNMLEPSAGVGVFHETKPRGVLMTATEIDTTSGTINQLLHPEDSVTIAPFEQLASSSADNLFDHCVGNVPFGNNRGAFANLDPAYSGEKNIGRYFILRLLDKIKPGGYACVIVPYGMTSGADMKRLREEVSRKAEFLGAHRLPTGTFDESGTSTVVDVQVFRKHPEELADFILQADESLLTAANVLWPTYINGKWFEQDGKRFVYGEQEKAFRGIVVKNDQVSNAGLKQKLIHKFDSRINWDMLQIEPAPAMRAQEGDQRFINRQWYRFTDGAWLLDNTRREKALDKTVYGADTHEALTRLLSSEEGILSLSWAQLQAVARDYPQYVDQDTDGILRFVSTQKPQHRERLFRGSLVGRRIQKYRGFLSTGMASDETMEGWRQDLVTLVNGEKARFGNPSQGFISRVSGNGAGPWFAFKSAIRSDGSLSDLLRGTLDTTRGHEYNAADPADTVRHLFSQIDLVPVSLKEFREAFSGDLPADDNDLLDLLATKDDVAVTPDGNLVPFDRATSGDVGLVTGALRGAIAVMPDGPQRQNMLRQMEAIQSKRKLTDTDDIRFKLNSRWFDRNLVLQFLHEQGFDELQYVDRIETDDAGRLTSELNHHGRDGVFTGYRYGTIQSRDPATGRAFTKWGRKSVKDKDGFPGQLEKYLNGQKPGGIHAAEYGKRISDLEAQFNAWIRQHDDIDTLVAEYNDAFNSYIPYEQSDSSLNLRGVRPGVEQFGYQNQEVRRVSENGRGIIGLGTGLGKTRTALALEAYNFENGRARRTGTVVPKAVYENWYHEAKAFYSPEAFASLLFVGIEPVRDGSGNIMQVPRLDENGKPVIDKATGQPVMMDALRESDEATIKARMHEIPHSNYRHVIMTKEQYARIPLKPETVEEHAQDILHKMVEAGRVVSNARTHRDANRRNTILAKNSDTGSRKDFDYPYFEDMGFDNIIADEGHNYRNSYSAGREAASLAYLPVPSVAQSARDMAVKNAYLMAKNNGRGAVLLTATPLVNSPIDAFNMLSHVVSLAEWGRMGIHTPDDFVKEFGRTDLVQVQKISGEIEVKEGLVGFQNLDGLRGIFHRWASLKTAADVAEDVKIPELAEHTREAPMSDEQAVVYDQLRERAERLADENKTEGVAVDKDGNEVPKDSIFAIIRDMDRVCSDLDLYHRRLTFRFPAAQAAALRQLAADLPRQAGADDEESYSASGAGVVTEEGDFCQLIVPEAFEQEVLKRLAQFGLSDADLSHPIPPKYSALIEQLKEGLKRGKQIIFTDEKSQHGKLKRILCSALGMKPEQIGIINATSVAAAGKKGAKVKAVKPPKDLPEDPSDEQLAAYNEQLQAYENYVAAQSEVSLGGLEQIAADYNEGRTPIIICNKKAEVGINLHRGTTDIHHLTLPWTPASIDQRNGRGARVGSSQSTVHVHYYCGKGSFDEFRLKTLKRKKNWIREILTSDKAAMDNADADSVVEMQLLLAANPEERERRMREQQEKVRAAALAAAKARAQINLQNYMKAQHAAKTSVSTEEHGLELLKQQQLNAQREVDEAQEKAGKYQQLLDDEEAGSNSDKERRIKLFSTSLRAANKELDEAIRELNRAKSRVTAQQRRIVRVKSATSKIKQLRPVVADAIKTGLLDVDPDVVDHGDKMLLDGGRVYKVGQVYPVSIGYRQQEYRDTERAGYSRIRRIDFDTKTAVLEGISDANFEKPQFQTRTVSVASLPAAVDLTESELTLQRAITGGISVRQAPDLMSRQDFVRQLKEGRLRLTDGKGLVWLNGKYQIMVLNERGYSYSSGTQRDASWYKEHGEALVYPDRDDGPLKTAIATLYRGGDYSMKRDLQPFMVGLFGDNYETVLESLGETASPDVIEAFVAEWVASAAKYYAGMRKSFYGGTAMDISTWLDTGSYTTDKLIEDVRSRYAFTPPAQYKNQDDFERARVSALVPIVAQARLNTQAAVRAYATQKLQDVKDAAAQRQPSDKDKMLYVLQGKASLATAYALRYRAAHVDLDKLILDAALAGLIDLADLSADALLNSGANTPLMTRLTEALGALDDAARASKADDWQLMTGALTQADIDAREQAKADREANRDNLDDRLQSLGLVSRINSSMIRLKWRNRNMGSFAAGEARGFADPAGKAGKLFAAKEVLKERFNAKFQGDGAEDSDFPGSWWLIPSKYALSDVLDVIENA